MFSDSDSIQPLILKIATDLGRGQLASKWQETLEDNLYSTIGDIKKITLDELVAMKLPTPLFKRIQEEISSAIITQQEPIISPQIPPPIVALISKMHQQIGQSSAFEACKETLTKVLEKILESPEDNSKRSLRLSNAAFNQRVGKYSTAIDVLSFAGFRSVDVEGEIWLRMDFVDGGKISEILTLLKNFAAPAPFLQMEIAELKLEVGGDANTYGIVLDTLRSVVSNGINAVAGSGTYKPVYFSNEHFQRRAGRFASTLKILQVVGFVEEPSSHELVPPNNREILQSALDALTKAMKRHDNSNNNSMFSPLPSFSSSSSSSAPIAAAAAASSSSSSSSSQFDGTKPLILRREDVAYKVPGVPSTVDDLSRKINKLKDAMDKTLKSAPIPPRQLVKFIPGNTPPPLQAGGGDSAATTTAASPGDFKMLADAMKRAEVNREKNSNFRTSAMKELDSLMNKAVYTQTAIRVMFPDGSAIQAVFHPRETMMDVYALVRECLNDSSWNFTLIQTPPKVVFPCDDKTLEKAGLVPAAKLHYSPQGVVPSQAYLKSDLPVWNGDYQVSVVPPPVISQLSQQQQQN